MHKRIWAFVLVLCVSQCLNAAITSSEAKDHIGESTTVCGVVASAHFARSSRGQPTFINLDEPYPNQVFTVLIWGSDRPKFGAPEQVFANRKLCVTGLIKLFRGVPETIVYAPSQIKLQP